MRGSFLLLLYCLFAIPHKKVHTWIRTGVDAHHFGIEGIHKESKELDESKDYSEIEEPKKTS